MCVYYYHYVYLICVFFLRHEHVQIVKNKTNKDYLS